MGIAVKHVDFSNIFKGNFLNYITKYKENIQYVLSKYEYVIFMARKAICFYEAMCINGEISETSCKVFSSRVLDYNILNELRGKKVAIIDDVVVKGTSLNHVINMLSEYDVKAYVLVVACEEPFPEMINRNSNFQMCNSYVTLERGDIFSFAGIITEYIEASMCPFNVDQPIYTFADTTREQLNNLLVKYNAVNISNGVQQMYGIANNVIYFDTLALADLCPAFRAVPMDTVLKIRIMSSQRIEAIPFVLFPELTIEELENLYSVVSNSYTDTLSNVKNKLVSDENKMKLVSYYFSELLGEVFFCTEGIEFKKSKRNDIHQFSKCTDELFAQKKHIYNIRCSELVKTSIQIMNYSKFFFTNIVSVCYNVISESEANDVFNDSCNNIINDCVITLEKFEEAVNKLCGNAKFLASCVIDVFIDRGIMVPAIVHSKKGIIRAYKMGEYSKLTRAQLDSFISMLYEYQQTINNYLGKTEFEKLCVLYFNNAINKGIFSQQTNYEDDCYGISYSLFGPRVAEGKISYKVDYDSTLITKFCDHKNQCVKLNANGQISITTSISLPDKISFFKTGFAYKYSRIRQVFDFNSPFNDYVHTYTNFLTLKAIGNNKKNQYLSICAELYQITKLSYGFFMHENEDLSASECLILKGINSGLWKYWCYKNNALNETINEIFERDNDAGAFLLLDVGEPPFDKSKDWDSAIDDAARILFDTAFLIDAVFRVKERRFIFNSLNQIFKDGMGKFGESQNIADKINNRCQHYRSLFGNNKLSEEEFVKKASSELLKLAMESRRQLDFCDNVLENSSVHAISYKMLLIIFSTDGEFPPIVFDKLNELFFERIESDKYCRVYGVSNAALDLNHLFAENSQLIENHKLKLCVYDFSQISAIRCVEGKVKDHSIAKVINKIIDNYDNGLTRFDFKIDNLPILCSDNLLVLTPTSYNGLPVNQASQNSWSHGNNYNLNVFNISFNLTQHITNVNTEVNSATNIGTIDSIGKAAFIESSGNNNNINFN